MRCAGCDLLFDVRGFDMPPLDAGTVVDGIDGGPSGAYSTIAMLADDFEDNDFDVLWAASVNLGNTLTEQAGNVRLSMAMPGSYITMISKAYYAMQEGSFTIAVKTDATGSRTRAGRSAAMARHGPRSSRIRPSKASTAPTSSS